MCERFSCLPSALEQEDASLLGMVQLVDMVRDAVGGGED
jgi:hypothetical protein